MPAKRKDLKIEGANLWYLVGLITSDGCLSGDGRHIDVTSKDYNYLFKVREMIGITNKIGEKFNSLKQKMFHIQFSNKNFYDFLLSIGLTPAKSLSLGALKVPQQHFFDFVRGLIDGDGCIRGWTHPTNGREQWSLRIFSGSTKFLEWLQLAIDEILKAKGRIHKNSKNGSCHTLKFGKMAARDLLMQCYYLDSFSLTRKHVLAEECISSYFGWKRSKTTEFSLN